MSVPSVKKLGSRWEASVVSINAAGNLVTNIVAAEVLPFAGPAKIWIRLLDGGGRPLVIRGIAKKIDDADKHRPMALEGPSGFIEISIRDGSAAAVTKLGVGAPVTLEFLA
jgi:S-adenosylmethionine hydrolase